MLLGAIVAAGVVARTAVDGPPFVVALVAGVGLIVGGLALAYLGVRDLGRSLSPMPRPLEGATLVESGAYAHVRHPIYAALILIALGWSVATTSLVALGLTAVLALVLDLKSRREEEWLEERFSGYAAYATRTSRFIPRVY